MAGGRVLGDVFLDDGITRYAAPPARFEAGTPPIAEAVGLGAACEFLTEVGMDVWRSNSNWARSSMKV